MIQWATPLLLWVFVSKAIGGKSRLKSFDTVSNSVSARSVVSKVMGALLCRRYRRSEARFRNTAVAKLHSLRSLRIGAKQQGCQTSAVPRFSAVAPCWRKSAVKIEPRSAAGLRWPSIRRGRIKSSNKHLDQETFSPTFSIDFWIHTYKLLHIKQAS